MAAMLLFLLLCLLGFVYTGLCSKWRHISENILSITAAKKHQLNIQEDQVCVLFMTHKSLWYLGGTCLILHVESVLLQDFFMR